MNTTQEETKQKSKALEKNGSKHSLFSRISVRFVGFVVLATLLTGGIISFAAITISKNTIRQEILNNSHTQAELAAEFTANYIEVIEANIKSFSTRSSLLESINENNIQAATEMLEQFAQIQTVLNTCSFYDANGIQLATSNPNSTTVGQSFADREWFQQIKSTKLPFQSVPIKSRITGNAVVPYAVPILNKQGQLIGVFVGAISLEKLSDIIVKISISSDVSYLLIDLRNGGTIVAHRDPQMILTSVSESYTDIINLMLNGESGGLEVTNSNGEKDLISFAVLPNLPWSVIIVTPSETAFSSISALSQTSSILSAIIVLIVALLGGLFILQITRPIRLLVEETKEIGKGNLDYQIKTTGKSEIGDLSRAFSDMTGNLKKVMVSNGRLIEEADGRKSAEKNLMDLNETLEQRVEMRTAQLEISNKELAFQTGEKADRAAELIIANRELRHQNKEKEKRAAELIIANKKLAVQNEEISYLSYHDFLTGLYNRTYFEEEKIRLDKAKQLPLSFILGDINGLKLINDAFGHFKGDEILIEIAKILKNCCRKEDIVSRIGGDEFGILLPKTDSQSAQRIYDSIYDTCKEYALNEVSIYPSISLGYATKNIETETIDGIMIAAEESMSKQKLLESKSAHSSIITSIKAIMFEKSQETEEHAERMIQLSKSIGISMSLSDDQLNELELLSTLHDIGKMGIGADILSKPGKLSDEEWVEMRKHSEIGCRIAQATSEFVPIAEYILCHHERWDGKGYPQGLIGEKIPLLSRIVAIVDSFDAMTNDRVYRVAMTKGEAIEEIRRNSGTQFDPDISQLFLKLIA